MRKLIIGCLAALVLGALVLVFAGWWLRTSGVAKGEAMRTEGTEYGRGVAEPACVTEAMVRYKKNTGIVGGVAQVVWIDGCLETSEIDSAFCADVPSTDQMGPSVAWRLARCQEQGLGSDARCTNILAQVQTYCAGDLRKKKRRLPSRIEQPRVAQTYTQPPAPPRTATFAERPMIQITAPPPALEQVYADNSTKLFYAEKCVTRPENAYRMARKLAVMQGFKEGKCPK